MISMPLGFFEPVAFFPYIAVRYRMTIKDAKVLICDDSILARNQIQGILEQIGNNNCVQVRDGHEAVEALQKEHFDLMFLDFCMPNVDGIDVLKSIAFLDKRPYIIIVSSMCTKSMIVESLGFGANDFIQKPYSANQMITVIENWQKKLIN